MNHTKPYKPLYDRHETIKWNRYAYYHYYYYYYYNYVRFSALVQCSRVCLHIIFINDFIYYPTHYKLQTTVTCSNTASMEY